MSLSAVWSMLGVGLPSSLHSLCFVLHEILIPPFFFFFAKPKLISWSPVTPLSTVISQVTGFHCFCITSMLLSYVCLHVLLCVWVCLFWPPALVCSSPSVLRWLSASYWFLLCKATVSGTALICHCVRPTGSETVGPPRAVAAVLPRETKKTWTDLLHRRQTPNTTLTDMGLRLLTNNEENCVLTGIRSVWTTVFG